MSDETPVNAAFPTSDTETPFPLITRFREVLCDICDTDVPADAEHTASGVRGCLIGIIAIFRLHRNRWRLRALSETGHGCLCRDGRASTLSAPHVLPRQQGRVGRTSRSEHASALHAVCS